MSLTRKLEHFQLGLIKPSTFRESVLLRRVQTLRSSLYRHVVTTWDAEQRATLGDDSAFNIVPSAYHTIDIDKTETRYLLAGCADGSVEIFDLDPVSQSPKQRCKRVAAVKRRSRGRHTSHCNWVQWYPHDNGIFVTSGQDKIVKIWDTNGMVVAGSFAFDMPVHMHHMAGNAANGATHNLIAVASDESNVRLADMRTGGQTHHLHGYHKDGVVCAQWSPYDSNVLLSGGRDGQIICWDIRSGKRFLKALADSRPRYATKSAHKNPVIALKFAPTRDSFLLVSLDVEGWLRIWDALTFSLLRTAYTKFHVLRQSLSVAGIDFACHKDSGLSHNLLFVPAVTNVDVMSLLDGRKIRTLSGHMLRVNACAYRSGEYQELYTASADKTIGCFRPEHDENPDFKQEVSVLDKRELVDLTQDDWSD